MAVKIIYVINGGKYGNLGKHSVRFLILFGSKFPLEILSKVFHERKHDLRKGNNLLITHIMLSILHTLFYLYSQKPQWLALFSSKFSDKGLGDAVIWEMLHTC